jgi:hypothetical protein
MMPVHILKVVGEESRLLPVLTKKELSRHRNSGVGI